MTPHQRRIRDHELVCDLYRLAQRWVDLRESFMSPDAEALREILRAYAVEHVSDRILNPPKP